MSAESVHTCAASAPPAHHPTPGANVAEPPNAGQESGTPGELVDLAAHCDPDRRCVCDHADGWAWPMHWRPDAAPEAPWPWLDNRPR
jgi:hypothetical protein